MVVIKQSRYSYAETIDRLSHAIREAGNVVFATIDQSAAATAAGLTLRPTSLLIFGNPKVGTPVMDAFPLAGLALPLKLLIWEETAAVTVVYSRMSEVAPAYNVPANDPRIAAMDHALEMLTASVT